MTLKKKALENIVRKGENTGNQHFLLFHRIFYYIKERKHHFSNIYLSSANAFNLDMSKILSLGEELTKMRKKVLENIMAEGEVTSIYYTSQFVSPLLISSFKTLHLLFVNAFNPLQIQIYFAECVEQNQPADSCSLILLCMCCCSAINIC